MPQEEIYQKLEERRKVLEEEYEELKSLLQHFSRRVSETQVNLLEKKGELNEVIKMLNSLKTNNK